MSPGLDTSTHNKPMADKRMAVVMVNSTLVRSSARRYQPTSIAKPSM